MTPEELRELREIERDILRKNEYQVTACAGKFAFDSQVDARKAMHGKVECTIYRCGNCGKWHIGSVEQQRKRAKVRRNIYRMRRGA